MIKDCMKCLLTAKVWKFYWPFLYFYFIKKYRDIMMILNFKLLVTLFTKPNGMHKIVARNQNNCKIPIIIIIYSKQILRNNKPKDVYTISSPIS